MTPDSPHPFAVTLGAFIDRPRSPQRALLADADGRAVIAAQGLHLLGGKGGKGKTTLYVDLMVSLALGQDYLCFTVPEPVAMLVIENEGPADLFAEKLEARLALLDEVERTLVRGRVYVHTLNWGRFTLGDDEQVAGLRAFLAEHPVELVFGDPLDSLGIEGVGSPEDTRRFVALMKQAGLNQTTAWWLNAHTRKEEARDAVDEIAGSWGGRPDAILLLDMLKDNRSRLRFPKLRWTRRGKHPNILLAFDPEAETFSYIREEGTEDRDYTAEITKLLQGGKWCTIAEIAKPVPHGIGAGAKQVTAALESHPDLFETRTGQAAVEVGRHKTATVYALRDAAETSAQTSLDEDDVEPE